MLACIPAKAGTQTREALTAPLQVQGRTGLLPSQEYSL
jgi:hypothetical protein